jgi:hypothetical protein
MKTFNFFAILFFSIVLFNSCGTKTNQDLILGKWVSVDDPASTLEITENKWTFNITGEENFECDYLIGDNCATNIEDTKNPNGNIISILEYDEFYCYSILKLDQEILELSYLNRGNTLTYKRK